MEKQFANHPGLSTPRGYTHTVSAAGSTTVYVAGQVAIGRDGQIVGPGDLGAQAKQVFENLKLALQAAGAGLTDLVKITTFVVNYKPEDRAIIAEVRAEYLSPDKPPASTLVGVQALAVEGLLIEVEAVAVI